MADGARDNWTFLESLSPDVMPVDFWHAAQHMKAAADTAFGADTAAGTAWFGKWRHVPPHDPGGVGRVTGAMRHLLRRGKGADDVRRELACFRGNRRRMHYADAANAGHPIGSGSVEAANRVLVTVRMKRSGQGRGRDGGQGVLTFRSSPGPDASTGHGPCWRRARAATAAGGPRNAPTKTARWPGLPSPRDSRAEHQWFKKRTIRESHPRAQPRLLCRETV